MAETRTESFAIDASRVRMTPGDGGGGRYAKGDVVTWYGVVAVYTQYEPEYTRYDFAYLGRHYMRTEERGRTNRGLGIMAARFAREIAEAAEVSRG